MTDSTPNPDTTESTDDQTSDEITSVEEAIEAFRDLRGDAYYRPDWAFHMTAYLILGLTGETDTSDLGWDVSKAIATRAEFAADARGMPSVMPHQTVIGGSEIGEIIAEFTDLEMGEGRSAGRAANAREQFEPLKDAVLAELTDAEDQQ